MASQQGQFGNAGPGPCSAAPKRLDGLQGRKHETTVSLHIVLTYYLSNLQLRRAKLQNADRCGSEPPRHKTRHWPAGHENFPRWYFHLEIARDMPDKHKRMASTADCKQVATENCPLVLSRKDSNRGDLRNSLL